MADELVTVGNFQFLPEAEFAQMRLESEGIQAFLADGQTLNSSAGLPGSAKRTRRFRGNRSNTAK